MLNVSSDFFYTKPFRHKLSSQLHGFMYNVRIQLTVRTEMTSVSDKYPISRPLMITINFVNSKLGHFSLIAPPFHIQNIYTNPKTVIYVTNQRGIVLKHKQ